MPRTMPMIEATGRWRRPIAGLALAACVALLPACSVPYVNIPHQSGDVAGNDPDARNVRAVEAEALRAVLAQGGVPTPVLIELPEGTDTLTYAAVASMVGEDAVPPSDEDVETQATLTVKQVRIRGWDAEVDLLRPGPGGVRQLATVYVEYAPLGDWAAKRVRTWRGPASTLTESAAPEETP